jgi:trans-2,3-dihydro-3-hydroxyanthranilate isomerase
MVLARSERSRPDAAARSRVDRTALSRAGRALERARICRPDLDARLAALGAQFAYLFDANDMEGRHWNNDGVLEDIATGSGAGCVAAYLRRRNRIGSGTTATLKQGRFLGRPSEILLRAHGEGTDISRVEVGGDVSLVGCGWLNSVPET